MNKKKGFTLIEIIICITLITIIGVAMTFTVLKSKDNKFKEVEKRILTAASVYVSTAKDENGETYENGIYNGGSGTVINLNVLYNNGFLSEDLKKEIEKRNYKLEDNYVLALLGNGEESNDCNGINYTLSWDKINKSNNKDKPVYLCKKNNQQQTTDTNIKNIIQSVKMKVHIDKNAVSTEFYNKLSAEEKAKFTDKENGLYAYYQENQGDGGTVYYYYRGAVNNNYVKFGTENNKELTWRILWINDKNEMKLVLDDEIYLTHKRKGTTTIDKINANDSFYSCNPIKEDNANIYSVKVDESVSLGHFDSEYLYGSYKDIITNIIPSGTPTNAVIYNLNKESIFYDYIKTSEYINLSIDDSSVFSKLYENWFNSANLSNSVKDYDFCFNSEDYGNFMSNFECYTSKNNITGAYGKYTKKYGYLSMGELARAGIVAYNSDNNYKFTKNDNYLIPNENNSYILIENNDVYYGTNNPNNYVNSNGIENKKITNTLTSGMNSLCIPNNLERTYEIYSFNNRKKNIEQTTFYANSIKPVIVVDLNKYELSDSTGTNDDMFTLIEKTE